MKLQEPINHEIAVQVCQIYINTYLENLAQYRKTLLHQVSPHYNMTIKDVRDGCAFDVEHTSLTKVCIAWRAF